MKLCMASIFLLLTTLVLSHFPTPNTAKSSPSPAPTPTPASAPSPSASAGPPNITAILTNATQFTTFIRLLTNTQESDQIHTQLNNSNQGLTVFAPTDSAFSSLKPGTLNSLNNQEQVELIQYHILPSFISTSQFSTASNPLRTQAGGSNDGRLQLNVTTSGNQVNLTTGVVETTVGGTVYSDGQLAVYQVDQVLLPLELFGPPAPATAPAPVKGAEKKSGKASESDAGSDDGSVDQGSSGVRPRVSGFEDLAKMLMSVSFLFFMVL